MAVDPISIAVSTFVGLLVKIVYDTAKDRRSRKAEVKAIGSLSVRGEWFAAWQTSVNGEPNINLESVVIEQVGATLSMRNRAISPDNPEGGYLWHGTLKFCAGRRALGYYVPVDPSDRDSEGVLYLVYNAPRKLFIGEWVGSSFDGDLCRGYAVLAKDSKQAQRVLCKLLDHQPFSAVIAAEQAARINASQLQRGGQE